MSSNSSSSKVVSVDEQAFEKAGEQAVDEDGFPVVDETPEFEAAVEQETQAKVDANHPDGIADTSEDRIHGVTLEQEERIRAREAELERISAQAELGTQEGREQRTREVVREQCGRDEPAPAERTDPREKLTQEELAAVNEQAMRISDEVQGGWVRAVVAKQLAEKVQRGQDMTKAVLETLEELKAVPGAIVPIADVPDVPVGEVTVEGTIETLWEPSSSTIQQVGLIADGKRAYEIHDLGEEREDGGSRRADSPVQSGQEKLVPGTVQSRHHGLEQDRIPGARSVVGRIAS